jgi:hypothetical protein
LSPAGSIICGIVIVVEIVVGISHWALSLSRLPAGSVECALQSPNRDPQ